MNDGSIENNHFIVLLEKKNASPRVLDLFTQIALPPSSMCSKTIGEMREQIMRIGFKFEIIANLRQCLGVFPLKLRTFFSGLYHFISHGTKYQ